MRIALLLAGCALVISCRATGLPTAPETLPKAPYRIIGYVTGRTDIDRIDAMKLTHINYAFGQVNDKGEIFLNDPTSPAHLAQLHALKAKNPQLKIILSVGGWGADGFSDAALTDESRERFARSGAELVKRYALDGIDLDWEYPGQAGPGIKFRPEDKQNFTLMLKTMRQQLDALSDQRKRTGADRYVLTIASADREYFDHTEMDKLHEHLDWINIMAYDFYNSLTKTTGHHTGLFRAPGAPESSRWTEASVKQHLAAGIPPAKLVVGVAFYGRAFVAGNADNPLNQPYERYVDAYSWSDLTSKYIDKGGFERRWDDVAKAPWLWNGASRTLISYDDPQSLKEKARFIKQQGLGGVMYWEHGHDPDEALLSVLHAELR